MRDLTNELVTFLLSPRAKQALDDLATQPLLERETLPLIETLRREFTPDQAAALLDQARLRRRAQEKFERAGAMFFTDEGLQQASGQTIASYRAGRYAAYTSVADLGCGIGGDSIALGLGGREVAAIDLDRVRLRLARANAGAYEVAERILFIQADWTRLSLRAEAAFADPSRRVDGRRVFSLHAIQPPLAALLEVQRRIPALGVKVAPGVSDEELPADVEVEFISEGGTLKEAVLWFGALRSGVSRRATLLPGGATLTSEATVRPRPVGRPRAILYEPDPAILRASLVEHLATALNAALLDPTIAYLTADDFVATPFARAWRVIEDGPFNRKALNRRLRALDAEVVAVKKRGSPIEPEQFRKQLTSAPGGRPVTVFVTRVEGRPWMILAAEIERTK